MLSNHQNNTLNQKHYEVPLKDPLWNNAMQEEICALHLNQTWELVPQSSNANVIRSKWVYHIKFKEDGSVDCFKARLVAQGFTQNTGINFDETFNPVVKHTTIRFVIAFSLSLKCSTRQLDVKNAFLHGKIKETIYMEHPPEFVNLDTPDHAVEALKEGTRAVGEAHKIGGYATFTTLPLPCMDLVTVIGLVVLSQDEVTTCYCVFLGANCISWYSKKQSIVAHFSTEAEYCSTAHIIVDLTWITYLFDDTCVSLPRAPQLFCDDISALHMTVNPVVYACTKHIEFSWKSSHNSSCYSLYSYIITVCRCLYQTNGEGFVSRISQQVRRVSKSTCQLEGT
ncbi:uncharacterized protein [Cicer arietinum]|uniref:uncharacterized protein n=1 Tax=Cicer arietinum TaxID=3827 RepID=UPI003CC52068